MHCGRNGVKAVESTCPSAFITANADAGILPRSRIGGGRMPELYVSQTWKGRWVVARKRCVEHESDRSILANFADREHAENWLAGHQKWREKLRDTTP